MTFQSLIMAVVVTGLIVVVCNLLLDLYLDFKRKQASVGLKNEELLEEKRNEKKT